MEAASHFKQVNVTSSTLRRDRAGTGCSQEAIPGKQQQLRDRHAAQPFHVSQLRKELLL